MTASRLVIVTGANRGIGRAICQLILSRPDSSSVQLFATSRKGEDLGLAPRKDGCEVIYPQLDISRPSSIQAFATSVRQHGQVHALINNAGVNLDGQYGYENAKRTMDVNYRGTLEMCKAFIPLLSPDGRIVNLSSVASSLNAYSEDIRTRFRDPDLTLEGLELIAQDFEQAVKDGREAEAGFFGPGRSYSVSKACMNALTAAFSRTHKTGLTINACCPGWINTDMGLLVASRKTQPPKTPQEGASIPVRLALDDIGGVTGKYWANSSVRSRGLGEVQEW